MCSPDLFLSCPDASGAYEVTLFSETLSAAGDLLVAGQPVLIKATAQFEGETARLTAQSVRALDKLAAQTAAGLRITVMDDKPLAELSQVLGDASRGRGTVTILARTPKIEAKIALQDQSGSITPELLHALNSIAGIVEIQEV